MAHFKAYRAVDMAQTEVYYGEVTVANSNTIKITDGYYSTVYKGNFNYDYYGDIYGRLDSMTSIAGSATWLAVSGINRDANTYSYLMEWGTVDDVFGFILSSSDRFTGSSQNDNLRGYGGNDVMSGGAGSDRLRGDWGNDWLGGGDGNDRLEGGSGTDYLVGGRGKDVLYGQAGADTFAFDTVQEAGKWTAGRDVVRDFRHGDDHIRLTSIDADTTTAGNQRFHFIYSKDFTGKAGELNYKAGVVSGDVNGDMLADFHIEISNLAYLDRGDFLL